ncbi:MAG: TIM44-like domain-containing protein [Candidatus Riflebacteria bacterium]|nr:TIM44-like domain-containing protein [Candidatus Riflebacteria bacterium]
MYKKSHIFILSIVFFISFFVFFATSIVDARAGGGHRYSGGSHRSSSRSSHRSYSSHRSSSHRSHSYHSSGSSGTPIDIPTPLAIFFIITHLVFAGLATKAYCDEEYDEFSDKFSIAVAIAVLSSPFFFITWFIVPFLILYLAVGKRTLYNSEDYRFTEVFNFSSIKSKDPAFNKDEFLERAKKAFVIVQEGWSKRDLSKAEAFLADGTYEQFQIQINTMKADHEIDLMKDIDIKKAVIVRLSSKAGYDSLSVQFTVSAVNYRIDDRNNSFKNGSQSPEEFTEIWTFMRRRGTKTVKNGLIEGYCPNCGAQIEGARLSKCPSCSSLLRSGQHDWILTGITQACEWRDADVENPIAYKSMISADNSLNISHLEDKLTVIFWRLVEANRLGNSEPIQKVSTNEFAQSIFNSDYSATFPKCRECALGSQEIIGFITNRNDYDYLIGQLVWSGISVSNDTEVFRKSMVILRRKKGVPSDPEKSFCSIHCPNCGAKEPSDLSSNTCEYCGSVFNDDSKDWMLCDIVIDFFKNKAIQYMNDARMSAKGIGFKKETSDTPGVSNTQDNKVLPSSVNYNVFDYFSGNDLLNITVAMMLADGLIDKREMMIIHNIRKARSISNNELDQIISRLRKTSDPVKFVLDTTAIKLDENLIKLLISIAAADSYIEYNEVQMLNKVAEKMGLSQNRLRDLINEVYEKKWNR